MTTHFLGPDGTLHPVSNAEQTARDKLHKHVQELRESLLDLLSMVDNTGVASHAVRIREEDALRMEARRVELRKHKIRRAKAIIDGTKDAESLTGPQE
jgi:hypothetical protein